MISTPKTFLSAALAAVVFSLAVGAATAPAAAARSSKVPCWKTLINDWYDGRIDRTYEVHCYKDALRHLPQDVRTYSDAYDVISRALADATHGKKNVKQNSSVPPVPPSNGGGGSGGSGSGGSGSGGSGSSGGGGGSGGGGSSGGGGGSGGGGSGGGGSGSGSGGSGGSGGSHATGGGAGSGSSSGSGGSGVGAVNGSPTPGAGLGAQSTSGSGDKGVFGSATDELGSDSADSVPIPLLVLAGLALLLVAAGAIGLVTRRLQARRGSPRHGA